LIAGFRWRHAVPAGQDRADPLWIERGLLCLFRWPSGRLPLALAHVRGMDVGSAPLMGAMATEYF